MKQEHEMELKAARILAWAIGACEIGEAKWNRNDSVVAEMKDGTRYMLTIEAVAMNAQPDYISCDWKGEA